MLIFGMLTAIEFNYQFGFQAGKVGNVRFSRILAAEMPIFKLPLL